MYGLIEWLNTGDSNSGEGDGQTAGQLTHEIPPEQKCNYCGRTLSPETLNCPGCGTRHIPPIIEDFATPPTAAPVLNARKATLILLAYLIAQFCFAIVAGMIFAISSGAASGTRASNNIAEFNKVFLAPTVILSLICGGVVMIWFSWFLVAKSLGDTSEVGAAWVLGDWKAIVKGLGLGVSVAAIYLLAAIVLHPHRDEESVGPLTQMSMTKGLPQILWIIMALFLAPPLEEMLFRGVLYGGYRKSFGATRAAWLTTSIFALMHITEVIYFLPALLAIAGMALLALRMRLRHSAIGPAIAAHFGYNFILALAVICSTWFGNI
jgi:membrane protease YdiL (CAAX protease family)